jgi:predicted DNA-binding transcriptional regulator AlpA
MQPDDFWDIHKCCERIGGSRPIHPSTLYRLIKKGAWPKPVHPTPGISRCVASQCEAAIARMAESRP